MEGLMTPVKLILVAATGLLSLAAFVPTASAQATRTWVSGVGDDVNPCSRTAPCKTFAGAISKTATGGIINCLDQGAYGSVTITKTMTISCEGVTAGVLHSATNGIIVNASATSVVILRGLNIDGSPPTAPGLNGIRFLAGAALYIENCQISGSNSASPNGNGVMFAPSGASKLQINNSHISDNGLVTSGAGVQIAPSGTGSAEVIIKNTEIVNNSVAVRADSTATSGKIDVTIVNTSATHSRFHGVVAIGGNGPVKMMLDGVVASNNAGEGIRIVGPNANLRVGRSTINNNGVGITQSGGSIRSYGTNQFNGNTDDGVIPIVDLMR
jgi:hypothetical protein